MEVEHVSYVSIEYLLLKWKVIENVDDGELKNKKKILYDSKIQLSSSNE